MKWNWLMAMLAVSTIAAAAACGQEGPAAAGDSTLASAVTEGERFLYFRCNATGWDFSAATRLRSLEPGSTFPLVLEYEIQEDWMVSAGDTCVFSETDVRDGLGTRYREWSVGPARLEADSVTYYGPSVRNPLYAPDGSESAITHFTIKYAFKGRFQIAVMPYYDEYRFYISSLPSS